MAKKKCMVFVFAVFILLWNVVTAPAEVGVTNDEIVIGTIQAQTGDMAFIGNQNVSGTKIIIDEVNKKGGIFGRKIKQIVMDDGYVTPRHIADVRRLITQDNIFAFLANLGTHTVAASLPLLNQYKVPLYGACSNAALFDNEPYVFSEGASYRQMTIQAIHYFMKEKGHKKVAVFYWDNPLGQEHLTAAKEYMKAINQELVAEEKHKTEDYDLNPQAARLKASGATAVIIACSPGGGAKILKAMHNIGYSPDAAGPLMLASPGFLEVAGKDAEGLYLMLPFVSPDDPHLAPWKQAHKAMFPDKPFDNMVIANMGHAYVFMEALRRAGKDLTREKLIKAAETIKYDNFDLPHYKGATDWAYGPDRHRSTSATIIGLIKDGKLTHASKGWLKWGDIPVPEVLKR